MIALLEPTALVAATNGHTEKPVCVVCGAHTRIGRNTCDRICTAAKHMKIDRGLMTELMTRRFCRRPYPERNGRVPLREGSLTYNLPPGYSDL
jgi:hypothetical protein